MHYFFYQPVLNSYLGAGERSSVRIEDLDHDAYSTVCEQLNIKITGRDYRTLASKMGYAVNDVMAFQLAESPADSILRSWRTKAENDVNKLIGILREMGRDGLVDILDRAQGMFPCFLEVLHVG